MGFWKRWAHAVFYLPLVPRRTPKRDTWAGEWHYAYVTDVYDGDTFTIVVYRRRQWVIDTVRLARIDTPEMTDVHPVVKAAAIAARDALAGHILHKHVWLQCIRREKYKRILGEVYDVGWCKSRGQTNSSQWMLDHHFAVPYTGGKKVDWVDILGPKRNS